MDELRALTAFAMASAGQTLPLFEAHRPHGSRPREALDAAGNPAERIADLATPLLIDVLLRYPRPGAGRGRVSRLVHELDARLRDQLPSPLTRPDRAPGQR